MFSHRTAGFSLIEILVSLVILAIISTVGIYFYRDYIRQTVIEEAVYLAESEREIIDVALATNQPIGANLLSNSAHSNEAKLTWVVNTGGGDLLGYILAEMEFPTLGHRKVLVLERTTNGQWHCVAANKYFPADQTVDKEDLPEFCRSPIASNTALTTASSNSTPSASSTTLQCPPPGAPDHTDYIMLGAQHTCAKPCQPGTTRDQNNPAACLPDEVPGSVVEPAVAVVTQTVNIPVDAQPATCPPGTTAIDPNSPDSGISLRSKSVGGMQTYYLSKSEFKCHQCRGPKFICERSHQPQACTNGTVQDPVVGCINDIENLIDGSRYISRRCATISEIQSDFLAVSAKEERCVKYGERLVDAHFYCSLGCIGENCNMKTTPQDFATVATTDALAKALPPVKLASGEICVETQ